MKKGFLFILLAVVSLGMSAQDKGKGKEKETARIYRVETNPFKSNWFISGGVGAQMYFGDSDSEASFGKRLAPALDITVGKWFTPGLGLRFAYNGLQAKGATANAADAYAQDKTFSNGFHQRKWNVANFHGDVMLNLSNMLFGYNEERVYSFIPYAGAGIVHSWTDPKETTLGLNAGLINRFRLSPALDLNVELRGLLMKNAYAGLGKEAMAGLTVGLTYKFKKRGWDAVPTVPMVPESQLNEMTEKVNALKGENESLKRDLVAERNKKPEVVVQKEMVPGVTRLVVVFNIGKSNIVKREYMNIEAMAQGMKANSEKVYTITGYADKSTGSAEYNMKLSKKRAEAVRDLLVNEFGVPASQLKVDYKGGVSNMFYDDAKLSRVAIVE